MKNPLKQRRFKYAAPTTGSSWRHSLEKNIFAAQEANVEQNAAYEKAREIHNQAHHTQTVKSPASIGSGIVNIPEGMPESESIRITINTNGSDGARDIVLGDPTIYAVKGGAGFTQNPSGTVYSGTPKVGNTYDLWLRDVCKNTYVFHLLTLETLATDLDTTEGANAKRMRYKDWLYVRGDVQDRYQTKRIEIRDGRDPYQQDNTITGYTPVGEERRLDSLSCYVIRDFLENVEMTVRLYTTAVANGRV